MPRDSRGSLIEIFDRGLVKDLVESFCKEISHRGLARRDRGLVQRSCRELL